MDDLFEEAEVAAPGRRGRLLPVEPDRDAIAAIARCSAGAERPVLVLGTDVWADGAEVRGPATGRGARPAGDHQRHGPRRHPRRPPAAGHQGPVGRLRPVRPRRRRRRPAGLPARLRPVRRQGGRPAGSVVHLADSPGQLSTQRRAGRVGVRRPDRCASYRCSRRVIGQPSKPDWTAWTTRLAETAQAAAARDAELLAADTDPIHPARIYGELVGRLADDAVVIGDGGDFVSFAGKYVEPKRPGGWLDPGPYGCLGAGLGAAIAARIARPSAQIVLLLGDGAAGMSLMDVDTLGPARPAGGDGGRQQLVLGVGEAPDAVPVRVRRGGRARAPDVVRQGRPGARRRRRDRRASPATSAPRSTGRSLPTRRTSSTCSPTPRSRTRARRRACVSVARSCEIRLARDRRARAGRAGSPWTPTSPTASSPPTTTTPVTCSTPPIARPTPSSGSRTRDGDLVGTVTFCPPGSAVPRDLASRIRASSGCWPSPRRTGPRRGTRPGRALLRPLPRPRVRRDGDLQHGPDDQRPCAVRDVWLHPRAGTRLLPRARRLTARLPRPSAGANGALVRRSSCQASCAPKDTLNRSHQRLTLVSSLEIDRRREFVVLVAVVALEVAELDVVAVVEDVPAVRPVDHGRVGDPHLDVRAVAGVEILEPQAPATCRQARGRRRGRWSRARARSARPAASTFGSARSWSAPRLGGGRSDRARSPRPPGHDRDRLVDRLVGPQRPGLEHEQRDRERDGSNAEERPHEHDAWQAGLGIASVPSTSARRYGSLTRSRESRSTAAPGTCSRSTMTRVISARPTSRAVGSAPRPRTGRAGRRRGPTSP